VRDEEVAEEAALDVAVDPELAELLSASLDSGTQVRVVESHVRPVLPQQPNVPSCLEQSAPWARQVKDEVEDVAELDFVVVLEVVAMLEVAVVLEDVAVLDEVVLGLVVVVLDEVALDEVVLSLVVDVVVLRLWVIAVVVVVGMEE
jgi:hypothetical protein